MERPPAPPELGRRIIEARRAAGLGQVELARRARLAPALVERYEAGAADPLEDLRRIAAATERPLTWFLGDDGAASRDLVEQLRLEVAELRTELSARLDTLRRRGLFR